MGLQAQETLRGRVYNKTTKQPIPFVSIYIENTFTGTTSDANGAFSIEGNYTPQSKLVFKTLAYDTKVISVEAFLDQDSEVFISPMSYAVKEYETTAKRAITDPWKIVQKAINRIPQNMPQERFVLEGNYQQGFQDYKTDQWLDNSQSQIRVNFDNIKNKEKADSISLISEEGGSPFWEQFRYNAHALLPQYQIPDYGTNHAQFLLSMDPVRHYNKPTFDFVGRLDKDFIDNHNFGLDSIGVYNGENVYCITVYLRRRVRFEKVNLIYKPDIFFRNENFGGIDMKDPHNDYSIDSERQMGSWTFMPPFDKPVTIPIGNMKITTDNFAITYIDYTNGFGNDRYKYCAEYIRYEDKYYPSVMYFANKFIMRQQPNFDLEGASIKEGVKALMDRYYYDEVINEYSQEPEKEQLVNQVITNHTIQCPITTLRGIILCGIEGDQIYLKELIARTKVIEEIQDTFLYSDYSKYLHHRLIQFKLPSTDTTEYIVSDFSQHHSLLGDRTFKWYLNTETPNYVWDYKKMIESRASNISHFFPDAPLPISSTDEYRYIIRGVKNPHIYDKPDLIKGLIRVQ